jgi:hypothetical protein
LNKCFFFQDALLHAIFEEYVEGVETLLEWEEKNHKPGTKYVRNFHCLLFLYKKKLTFSIVELGGHEPTIINVHK